MENIHKRREEREWNLGKNLLPHKLDSHGRILISSRYVCLDIIMMRAFLFFLYFSLSAKESKLKFYYVCVKIFSVILEGETEV